MKAEQGIAPIPRIKVLSMLARKGTSEFTILFNVGTQSQQQSNTSAMLMFHLLFLQYSDHITLFHYGPFLLQKKKNPNYTISAFSKSSGSTILERDYKHLSKILHAIPSSIKN